MKVFVTACTAFVLAAAFAVISAIYTGNAVDKTKAVLDALPPDITEVEETKDTPEDILGSIEEAEGLWASKTGKLSFFVNHRELDEIDALMVTLHSAASSADSGHYASTLAALKERLKKLSSSESFSFISIF